jgi:1-acyl-sn-glycerol-3-phosphate acyltransferase
MRLLLAPIRVLALLALIALGLAVAATVFRGLAQPRRNRIIRGWSRLLLAICGTRLRVTGLPLSAAVARTGIEAGGQGRLLLANHISWIDVYAIHAACPSRFVAKAEIGQWPVVGTLVTLTGVLYIERGRRHAVAQINHRVRDRLRAGETVAVFPEGTTTEGDRLLPFHANLVAPALEVGCPIWPVALRYTEAGRPSAAAAFVGDMGLVTSLWNTLLARRFEVEVAFLPPVLAAQGETRHHVAERARVAIAGYLGIPLADTRPARVSPTEPAAAASDADRESADTAPGAAAGPASASR